MRLCCSNKRPQYAVHWIQTVGTYKVKEVKGSSVVAERRGRELLRAKNLVKVVKQTLAYLKEAEKEKTKKIIEEDIDVDMNKIRRRAAEMEEEMVEGAERVGEDQTGEDQTGEDQTGEDSDNYQTGEDETGEDSDDSRFIVTYDDWENRVEEVGHQITKSGRVVMSPDRFRPDTTTKKASLSPRERKRRQSMRKNEKQSRDW